MKTPLQFDYIFMDREVTDLRIFDRVRSVFPDQSIELIDSMDSAFRYLKEDSEKSRIESGKRILLLNNFKGEILKFCPARSPSCYLCCNLHTINLMSNCVYNCVYCILQSCLSNPLMQVHCNLDEILEELDRHDQSLKGPLRICTGEIADSLALDPVLGQAPILIDFFARSKNLYLELKTKSSNVDHILEFDSNGRTVVSFSINPEKVVRSVEFQTASLEERFQAARKLLDQGYQVAFNLDPVLYYEGWQNDYAGLFEQVKSQFRPGEILWFHVGILRYISGLDGVARQRFPGSRVFDEEFVQGPDKKYRYPKPRRDEMYNFIYGMLNDWDAQIPRYACVERPNHWKKFHDHVPANVNEVQDYLMKRWTEARCTP